MVIRFRRDCANFEDRRDIDGTVLCAKNHTSGVACDGFESRFEKLNGKGAQIPNFHL